ncbi:MFS transporter [Aurantiacibacter xanthus]|uniref:MFS transporter n=1 Tax=Aurantiacibacter xanthus TaxID=1784712 RepID=A0A3A1P8G9_9SPHN|nr:MFS transporter [Aurantiacibacter xanthus]RIV88119.1 MFS transporter [Aurantiacibacter xanthus]
MTSRRIIALVLLAGVFIMEGFDIAAMSLAVPRLEVSLGLDPAGFGWVFTALLVGLGLGGALIAPLGDRFGRRTLIVLGCLGTGLATLGTASSSDIEHFLFWRTVTGLALGACLPNVSALSSELAPEKMRATLMAVVSAGIPVGLALAGLLAPELIAVLGWQGLFLVPGGFAVVLAGTLFLALEGGAPAREPADAAAPKAKLPQLVLFSAPWLFPFAVFAAMLAFNALNLYLLNSWLPTVLPGAGLSLDDAARVAGVANLAGLGIGIGASLLLDRWHKGLTLALLFGSMAASFAMIALTAPDQTRWTLLLMVGVGGANAGGMVLPGLCAYLFPARLLSSAVGMGVLVARLGAFAGPPLGGAMIAAKVPAQTFLGVAAIPALVCVLVALLVSRALLVRQRVEPAAVTA